MDAQLLSARFQQIRGMVHWTIEVAIAASALAVFWAMMPYSKEIVEAAVMESKSVTNWCAVDSKLSKAVRLASKEAGSLVKDEADAVITHADNATAQLAWQYRPKEPRRMLEESSRCAAVAQVMEDAVAKIAAMTSKADAQAELARAIAQIDQIALSAAAH